MSCFNWWTSQKRETLSATVNTNQQKTVGEMVLFVGEQMKQAGWARTYNNRSATEATPWHWEQFGHNKSCLQSLVLLLGFGHICQKSSSLLGVLPGYVVCFLLLKILLETIIIDFVGSCFGWRHREGHVVNPRFHQLHVQAGSATAAGLIGFTSTNPLFSNSLCCCV